MFKLLFVTIFCSYLNTIASGDTTKIDPELLSSLENGDPANVLIFFATGVQPAIERTAALKLSDRSQRNFALYDSLRDHADSSQNGVTQLLSSRSAGSFQYYKSYWTGNKVFIKQADVETVKAVAEDPQVLKIKREPRGFIPEKNGDSEEVEDYNTVVRRDVPEFWLDGLRGINKTQVHEAWEEMGGGKGEGVVVANIDTGVRYTHEALRDNFVGIEYGWLDPFLNTTEPADIDGHGTQTMGIVAGSYGIGVAPGVKWMACRAGDFYFPGEALLDCIKWLACPTLRDGTNPDCSKAPHVINNSWATDRGADDFNEDILVWRAMGIIPVFGTGNSGVGCNTTHAPGENPFVIGVGYTNSYDWVMSRSSVGWASDGGIKPDLVAPGAGITSAYYEDDIDYHSITGSSAAAPFVTGVVALLKTRDLDLTYDEAYEFLTQNTYGNVTFNPGYEDRYCKESTWDVVPSIFYGYGSLNALKVVQAQTRALENS